MKIIVEKDTKVWVNGKEIKIPAGIQEVDDDVGRIVIQAGYAKEVKEEDKKKVR